MNRGTILRAIFGLIALVFMGICMFTAAKPIFCIIALVLGAAAMFINHWYNNDYSPEHCEATGLARIQKKERQQKSFIGERFFEDFDEEVGHE